MLIRGWVLIIFPTFSESKASFLGNNKTRDNKFILLHEQAIHNKRSLTTISKTTFATQLMLTSSHWATCSIEMFLLGSQGGLLLCFWAFGVGAYSKVGAHLLFGRSS